MEGRRDGVRRRDGGGGEMEGEERWRGRGRDGGGGEMVGGGGQFYGFSSQTDLPKLTPNLLVLVSYSFVMSVVL